MAEQKCYTIVVQVLIKQNAFEFTHYKKRTTNDRGALLRTFSTKGALTRVLLLSTGVAYGWGYKVGLY